MAQQPHAPQPQQPLSQPAQPLPPPQAVAPPHPTDDQPSAGLDRPMELAFPAGLPYTVYFPGDDGQLRGADLEHPAPVPRVGELIEYIDERGECRRYIVREVIHTLQTSAAYRPLVDAERYAAASVARTTQQQPERPGDGGELRAGLPKVFVDLAPEQTAREQPPTEQTAREQPPTEQPPTEQPQP